MRVAVVGGGPGGLYFALLLKKAQPSSEIVVYERNPRGATYGWGVVFSDRTLTSFREADYRTYDQITDSFIIWDAIDVRYGDRVVRCGGQVFSGIARKTLLGILQTRCDELGVTIHWEREVPAVDDLGAFDLVVGADGVHSQVRRLAFGPEAGFVRPLGMYVATVRLPEAGQRGETVLMYNAPGAATALHPGNGTPGAAFMFRSARRVDSRDRAASRNLLTEVYGSLGWRVPELLAAYLAADDTYFDAVCRVRTPTWSRGPVALLGDAASCVSLFGEGSTAAIVGARTLAESLDTFSDLPTALARYESQHRRFVARGQRSVRVISHLLIPATSTGIRLRNGALRVARRVAKIN